MPRTKKSTSQIFVYEVYDKRNERISGEISARSLNLAKAALKTQGYNIIKVKPKPIDILAFLKGSSGKSEEVTLFTRQMATLVTAGIPLVQALGLAAETLIDTNMHPIIQRIKVDVESGSAFSVALKKYPGTFDDLYCGLMETGEQTGTLDTMLGRVAVYREKSESLKRKVKKAMYYPIAVLVVAGIVTAILLVKVVPTFKEMFETAGAPLPAFTQFVISISDALRNDGLYILAIVAVIITIFIQLYRKNETFNHTIQRLQLRLPIIGNILKKTAVARFTRTLATTVASGIPLVEALDSVGRAAGNIVYKNAITKIKDGISIGQQLRVAMRKTGVFPGMVVQMIGIGEESGSLEAMLSKLANIYEEEVDMQVDGLTTLLEPLIMSILGIIVGGLVIAMYMPIFKMGALF